MDYVKYIRSMVGNSPINLTGVNVIVVNDKNEILLQKRGDFPSEKWGLIGGIVELGESLEDAAIREAKEETNLNIKNLILIGTTSGKDMYLEFPNGNKAYFISIGFITRDYDGMIEVDGKETLDLKFFSYKNLPDNMPNSHRMMIDKVQNELDK